MNTQRTALLKRFAQKIGTPDENGCIPWLGATYVGGYGQIRSGGKHGPLVRAHRFAYELVYGPVPAGLVLDHLCRNPNCINPTHLEPVTQAENLARGDGASATNARKTHCKRGHEFNEENTAIRLDGSRRCKVCRRVA